MRRFRSIPNGFSLLEMLAVVTILGIISAIVLPRIGSSTIVAKKNSCAHFKRDLNNALEDYRFKNAVGATALSDLTPEYYPFAIPNCPHDDQPYTISATTGAIAGHTH